MCCGDAPAPDPLIGQAARENAAVAREALAWYKDIYAKELLPMQKEQQALGRTLIDRYLANMEKQQNFAEQQNAYYESTFKPVEQQMARDAMNYDSAENIARRQGIATAAVGQQFSNAIQENARNLSRYGLNPNSGAFAQTNERLMREAALQKAGASTGAAFDTMDKGIALRAGAANFGRNMPNTAASYYGGSNQSGGMAMNTSAQNINAAQTNAGVMGQGYNQFTQGMNSAGNLMRGDFNARMAGYNAEQQAIGGIGQGLGMAFGMTGGFGMFPKKADGGEIHEGHGAVRGPGGPVDDKVPAMLSNGEYVVPADVVKAKGLEFFEKLKAKYHTPAHIQRQKAIGG